MSIKTMPLEGETAPSWWGCLCACVFVPARTDLGVKLFKLAPPFSIPSISDLFSQGIPCYPGIPFLLLGESLPPLLFPPGTVHGDFPSLGNSLFVCSCQGPKCPNSGSLMAMGSGGNKKTGALTFWVGMYPMAGRKFM